MLQILMGADEHTAAEGPYARVMKTRKWLYLCSAASLAVSHGLYDPKAAGKLFSVIKIPEKVLADVLAFGAGYLLLQFVLLSVQLFTTYDIVLAERFTSRRADELSRAREAVRTADQELAESIAIFRQDHGQALAAKRADLASREKERQSHLGTAVQRRNAAEKDGTDAERVAQLRHEEARAKAQLAGARAETKRLDRDGLAGLEPEYDPRVVVAQDALAEAREALQRLRRQEPSERRLYRPLEKLIDLSRVALPASVGACAIWLYLR